MAYTIHLLESFDDGNATLRMSTFGNAGLNATAARTGSNAWVCSGGGFNGRADWPHPSSQVSSISLWFHSSGDTTSGRFVAWREGGFNGTVHMLLYWNGNDLQARRGDNTVLGTVSGVKPPNGSGLDISAWVDIHDSTGAVKIWLNGVLELDLSGIDTRNGGTTGLIDTVEIGNGSTVFCDDVVLATATAFSDAVCLSQQVVTRFPNANGNYSNLTGSDGNSTDNYLLVDEATPSATDYAGSSTPGHKDSYPFADVGLTGQVSAIAVVTNALKSGTEAIAYRPFLRRAGIDGPGTDVTLSTSMAYKDEIFQLDPTDSSALTVAKVDAMEMGFEVRTA